MRRDDAQICLTIGIKAGYESGRYAVSVCDGLGEAVTDYIVTGKRYSVEFIADYINRNFADNKRFENIKAVYDTRTDTFIYYGIDLKKLNEAQTEIWEDAGPECPWYQPPFGDMGEVETISLYQE